MANGKEIDWSLLPDQASGKKDQSKKEIDWSLLPDQPETSSPIESAAQEQVISPPAGDFSERDLIHLKESPITSPPINGKAVAPGLPPSAPTPGMEARGLAELPELPLTSVPAESTGIPPIDLRPKIPPRDIPDPHFSLKTKDRIQIHTPNPALNSMQGLANAVIPKDINELKKNAADYLKSRDVIPTDEKIQNLLEGNYKIGKEETTGEFGRKLLEDPRQVLPWMSGISEIEKYTGIAASAARLEADQATESDIYVLKNFIIDSQRDKTLINKIISQIAVLPSFMIEFATTGGFYSAGKKITTEGVEKLLKKLAKEGAEKLLKKKAVKLGLKIGAGIAGSAVQAPFAGATRIPATAIRRMIPEFGFTDEEMTQLAVKPDTGEDLLEASVKAFGDQWIEMASERSGGLFNKLGRAAKNGAIKIGILKAVQKANPGIPPGKITEAVRQVGFHGVLSEMGEEQVGDFGRDVFGIQDYNKPSAEDLLAQMVAFSIPGLIAYGGKRSDVKVGKKQQQEEQFAESQREALRQRYEGVEPAKRAEGIREAVAESRKAREASGAKEALQQQEDAVSKEKRDVLERARAIREQIDKGDIIPREEFETSVDVKQPQAAKALKEKYRRLEKISEQLRKAEKRRAELSKPEDLRKLSPEEVQERLKLNELEKERVDLEREILETGGELQPVERPPIEGPEVKFPEIEEQPVTEPPKTEQEPAEIPKVEKPETPTTQPQPAPVVETKAVAPETTPEPEKVAPARDLEKKPEVMTFDEFSASRGVSSTAPSFPEAHRHPRGTSKIGKKQLSERISKELTEWENQRDALRKEFQDLVNKGEIREPTSTERLERAAKLDTEQGAAARRVIEKRKARQKALAARETGKVATIKKGRTSISENLEDADKRLGNGTASENDYDLILREKSDIKDPKLPKGYKPIQTFARFKQSIAEQYLKKRWGGKNAYDLVEKHRSLIHDLHDKGFFAGAAAFLVERAQIKRPLKKVDIIQELGEAHEKGKKLFTKNKLKAKIARVIEKQPWEMRQGDYAYSERYNPNIYKASLSEGTARKGIELKVIKAGKIHKQLVKKAIRAGKPVPAEVLADYPDLAKTPEAEKPTENIYMRMPIERVREDADKGVKLAKEALAARKPSKKEAEPAKESIEEGISQKRASELTGSETPSAFEIRDAFDKMTPGEQNIVITNIENEIREIEEEIKSLREQRKNAFVPGKLIFTKKIKQWREVLNSKKESLSKKKEKAQVPQKPTQQKAPEPSEIKTAKAKEVPEVSEKLPWEMTQEEWWQNWVSRDPSTSKRNADAAHKLRVRDALAAGEPVPAEVLADYPDLAKQATKKKPEFITDVIKSIYSSVISDVKAEKPIAVSTALKTTRITKPEHLRISKNGDKIEVASGRKWLEVPENTLENWAEKYGLESPFDFRRRAEREKQIAAEGEAKVGRRKVLQSRVLRGEKVPLKSLNEFKGEEWADDAVARLQPKKESIKLSPAKPFVSKGDRIRLKPSKKGMGGKTVSYPEQEVTVESVEGDRAKYRYKDNLGEEKVGYLTPESKFDIVGKKPVKAPEKVLEKPPLTKTKKKLSEINFPIVDELKKISEPYNKRIDELIAENKKIEKQTGKDVQEKKNAIYRELTDIYSTVIDRLNIDFSTIDLLQETVAGTAANMAFSYTHKDGLLSINGDLQRYERKTEQRRKEEIGAKQREIEQKKRQEKEFRENEAKYEDAKKKFLAATTKKDRQDVLRDTGLWLEDGYNRLGEFPVDWTVKAKKIKKAPDYQAILEKNNTPSDESRETLQGVYHAPNGDIVATDGHQIIVVHKASTKNGKILAKNKTTKKIKPIEGKYPNYRNVIPKYDKSKSIGIFSVDKFVAVQKAADKAGRGIGFHIGFSGHDGHFYAPFFNKLAKTFNEIGVKTIDVRAEKTRSGILLIGKDYLGKKVEAVLMPAYLEQDAYSDRYNYVLQPEPTKTSIVAGQPKNQPEPSPSPAQIESGNYKKGHVTIQGMDISIENAAGQYREGVDESGKKWRQRLHQDYGYIRGTKARDKDHIDVFIGPKPERKTRPIFVVDQIDQKTGKFDEPKVMLGFATAKDAERAYKSNYEKGWKVGKITMFTPEQFKEWAFDPKLSVKPAADFKRKLNAERTKRQEKERQKRIAKEKKAVRGAAERAKEQEKPVRQRIIEGEIPDPAIEDKIKEHADFLQIGLKKGSGRYNELQKIIDGEGAHLKGVQRVREELVNDLSKGFRMREGGGRGSVKQLTNIATTKKQRAGRDIKGLVNRDVPPDAEFVERIEALERGEKPKPPAPKPEREKFTREKFQEALLANDKFDFEHIPAIMGIFDATAETWAKRTGKTVDDFYDHLEDLQIGGTYEQLQGELGQLFQYVGQNAQLSDTVRDNLEVARDMERAGKDAEVIRVATGWFRGPHDNKWRYEIPDDIKFKENPYIITPLMKKAATRIPQHWVERAKIIKDTVTLGMVVDAPSVFKKYPQIKNVPVRVEKSEYRGAYDRNKNVFYLNVTDTNVDEIESTLAHEIQHYIQEKEGFARGSNIDEMAGKLDSDFKRAEKMYDGLLQIQNSDAFKRAKSIYDKSKKTKRDKQKRDNSLAFRKYYGMLRRIREIGFDLNDKYVRNALETGAKEIFINNRTAYEAYRRVAGEIEARDVQARRKLTPSERRKTKPYSAEDIAPAEAIVLFQQDVPLFQSTPNPVFFSKLERTLEQKLPGKGDGSSYLKTIEAFTRKGEFKKEELDWLGLNEWLAKKGKVTKQEVLDFVRQNQVELREKEKGVKALSEEEFAELSILEDAKRSFGLKGEDKRRYEELSKLKRESKDLPIDIQTKYAEWQLPGGKEYREFLIMLPDKDAIRRDSRMDEIEKELKNENLSDVDRHNLQVEYRNLSDMSQANKGANIYRSPHFDEANILAHVRFNERTDTDGKRVLFIEEFQSDWHQAGRKKGYKPRDFKQKNFVTWLKDNSINLPRSEIERQWKTKNGDEIKAWSKEQDFVFSVPDAPFKKNWHELAFKRMLRYAVDNGFDRIAWTTGAQQIDRYTEALRQNLDNIKWQIENGEKVVRALKDGTEKAGFMVNSETGKIMFTSNGMESAIGKTVDEVFGKGIAQEIMQKPLGDLKGEGLSVGGQLHILLYDQKLPQFANKYAKKWGARVGRKTILPSLKTSVHFLDVTPKMRESVAKGQPLFQQPEGRTRKGMISFGEDGRALIRVFDGGDVSTIMEELMHFFEVHVLNDPAYKADRKILDDWAQGEIDKLNKLSKAGKLTDFQKTAFFTETRLINGEWKSVTLDEIKLFNPDGTRTVAAREILAKGWQQYLATGKAPTTGLQRIFDLMKEWMLEIYKSMEAFGITINKDVSGVFDRMLAGEKVEVDLSISPEARRIFFGEGREAESPGTQTDFKSLPQVSYENLKTGDILVDQAGDRVEIVDIFNKEKVPAQWGYELQDVKTSFKRKRPFTEIERYYKKLLLEAPEKKQDDLSEYPIYLSADGVHERRKNNLSTKQKIQWAVWRRNLIQHELKESRAKKAEKYGIKWANKNAQKLKTLKEKELLRQRGFVEQYAIDLLPKYDSHGDEIKYSDASLKKLFEFGEIPQQAQEKLEPPTIRTKETPAGEQFTFEGKAQVPKGKIKPGKTQKPMEGAGGVGMFGEETPEVEQTGLFGDETLSIETIELGGKQIEQMKLRDATKAEKMSPAKQREVVRGMPERKGWQAVYRPKDGAFYYARKKADEKEVHNNVPGVKEFIEDIYSRIKTGEKLDNPKTMQLAEKHFGGSIAQGTFESADVYDAVEAAVNKLILDAKPSSLNNLREILKRLPRQSARTQEKDIFQQFSTPPTQAFVANYALNPDSGDLVLEPSAGVGGLAVFARNSGADVHTNEISKRRLGLLKYLGFETTDVDAEFINDLLPDNIQPTAILMNPPFSATGGRVATNKTKFGARHVEQALNRLAPNGRLVAIVGEGMAIGKENFSNWWKGIAGKYNVRANLGIPGEEYARYGTTFDNQIVVIDKTGATPGKNYEQQLNNIVYGKVKNLEEAINALEEIRQDRPVAKRDVGRNTERIPVRRGEPAPTPERRSGQPELGRRPEPTGKKSDQDEQQPEIRPESVYERESQKPAKETPGKSGRPTRGTTVQPRGRSTENAGLEIGEGVKSAVRETEASGKFVQYKPLKLKLKNTKVHPAKIVESASMAAVDPPDITYVPKLSKKISVTGKLSDLQLETISYAGQRFQKILPSGHRAGYFIGDGTGVGKGRQIAGIIQDQWNQGVKRVLWVSVSQDLMVDAKRDLDDTGFRGKIVRINDFAANEKINLKEGVVYSTYSSLISSSREKGAKERRVQLEEWLGEDSIIIFDEAHKAKNALVTGMGEPTKTAQAVLDIQNNLPGARVIYSSATGATEVRNMAYMSRLGLWGQGTPFPQGFTGFLTEVEAGGIGAMEMVARDMKALGLYNSRSISFDGVSYREITHELTDSQKRVYDTAAKAWQSVLQNFEDALVATNASGRAKMFARAAFWSEHQRFFKQVMTAMKVPTVIKEVEQALKGGKSAVISLIGTGESRTKQLVARAIGEGKDLDSLDFSPRESIGYLVDRAFPTQQFVEKTNPDTGTTIKVPLKDGQGNPVESKEAVAMKNRLLDSLGDLQLPDNPLDQIINHFGAEKVAELTGRSKRLIRDKRTNRMSYVKRNPKGIAANKVNIHEMKEFQSGKKRIAIISDAASTGISLHSDKKSKNTQQRVQITLELSWSADKQMQTFGRTHRSDQRIPPEYVLASTNIGGEKRFSSTIARRLASLGALTKGQRDTSGGDSLAKYNFETDEGMGSLKKLYGDIMAGENIPGLSDSKQALRDMGILVEREGREGIKDNDTIDVTKFLNRVLALDVDRQNALFEHYYSTFEETVLSAKESGTFDDGVADIKGEAIRVRPQKSVINTDETTGAETVHSVIEVDQKTNPLSFETAQKKVKGNFYYNTRSKKYVHVESIGTFTDAATGTLTNKYRLVGPANNSRILKESDFTKTNLRQVDSSDANLVKWWNSEVQKVPKTKTTEINVIGGAILPIWNKLKARGIAKLKVVRVQADNGERVVGVKIPNDKIASLLRSFGVGKKLKTGQDVFTAVFDNKEKIKLVGPGGNTLTVEKIKLYGNNAIELSGVPSGSYDVARNMGLIGERINYEQRFFIPTEKAKGIAVLDKALKQWPVQEQEAELSIRDRIIQQSSGSRQFARQPEKAAPTKATFRGTKANSREGAKLIHGFKKDPKGFKHGVRSIVDFLNDKIGAQMRVGKEQLRGKQVAAYEGDPLHLYRTRSGAGVWNFHEIGHGIAQLQAKADPEFGQFLADNQTELIELTRREGSFASAETEHEGFGELVRLYIMDPQSIDADLKTKFEKIASKDCT